MINCVPVAIRRPKSRQQVRHNVGRGMSAVSHVELFATVRENRPNAEPKSKLLNVGARKRHTTPQEVVWRAIDGQVNSSRTCVSMLH